MINNVNGFHLELTNKCYLKCPECARTKFLNRFGTKNWKNFDINLDHLKNFFDIDLSNTTFTLCGNFGDPIYYPNLLELLQWIKSNNAKVNITTNGSYRKQNWWHQIVNMLDNRDTIIFSIDGTPENFTKYRINGDWESIRQAITICTGSNINTIWKYIPFSFNETDIDQVKALSVTLGFNEFKLDKSDRWETVDNTLMPTKLTLVSRRNNSIIKWKTTQTNDIDPECLRDSIHYISAQGFYMPRCYVGDWRFYYKTEFYKNKNIYDISNTTISKILSNEKTINFYNTLTETKLPVCTYNCPKL